MTKTTYGIKITDKFGNPNAQYSKLAKEIQEKIDNGAEPRWVEKCPSNEDYQLVIGFPLLINKHIDFNVVKQDWKAFLKTLPQEVKELILDEEEDIVIMSGEYRE